MRKDADRIIRQAIQSVMPEQAVREALEKEPFSAEGSIIMVAVGKAGWRMAAAASQVLGERIHKGVVVTRYGCDQGPLPNTEIIEAAHPVPDENSVSGAEKALKAVQGLKKEDTVLFLLSGGGSALFEKPLIPLVELQDVNRQLLLCGASITEINAVRKRLSAVKGGKFAAACSPAKVISVILSDVLGDPLDMIASGPTCQDRSQPGEALRIAQKYALSLSPNTLSLLSDVPEKLVDEGRIMVTGNVKKLCEATAEACRELGYEPRILTEDLCCEAKEAGKMLSRIAREQQPVSGSVAYIAGGETVVHVTGSGKGGRNQEIALSAAEGIAECRDTCVFSVGSDGLDGPTDAAGGYADEHTMERLKEMKMDIEEMLRNNDAYPALSAVDGLIMTGPTGTNVNDVSVVLIRR